MSYNYYSPVDRKQPAFNVPVVSLIEDLEEVIYIDSLLSQPVEDSTDDFKPIFEADEYHRTAIATLLNASYVSLPPALPAVVCAVGYIIRYGC